MDIHPHDRTIDELVISDVAALAERVKRTAVSRRNARSRHSTEHLITALRSLCKHALVDGTISDTTNPAVKAAKPRRQPSARRGSPDMRVEELLRKIRPVNLRRYCANSQLWVKYLLRVG